MKTAIALSLSILAVVNTGSQAPQVPQKPKAVPVAAPTQAAPALAGHWYERSVQCAQLAEKVAARERAKSQADRFAAVFDGWTNHYSLTFDCCFVLLTLKNPPQGAFPPSFQELIDALENRSLALYTGHPGFDALCLVKQGGPVFNCDAAAAYIAERMNK